MGVGTKRSPPRYTPHMLLLLLACTENNFSAKEDPSSLPPDAETDPDIAVTPGSVDFGEVAWGSENTGTITITNEGADSLLLDTPTLTRATSSVSFTALGSSMLPAGGSTTTVVTWLATDGMNLEDSLVFGSNDPDEPTVEVPLAGTLPTGEIDVSPAIHDFGTLLVGASDSVIVTVSNVGSGPLTVDNLTFFATDADLAVADYGGLATLPLVLQPAESTDLLVGYAPSDGTGDEGTLAVYSDDPDTPEAGTVFTGQGEDPDPCAGFTQHVKLTLTADDAWQGWLDATAFSAPGQNSWSSIDSLEWDLDCGDHTLALYATDTAQVIAGVLAAIEVEGTVTYVSGPTDWTMTDTAPAADWAEVAFDDSAWHIPAVCGDTSPWGSTPQPLYDLGAQWIWWTTDCRNLGEAWLRLNFTVP